MERIQQPVTGNEHLTHDTSPFNTLVRFYRSFNARDLAGLASNWLEGLEPTMDNPIGGIRRGWDEIHAGYVRLFNGPAQVTVEFHGYTQQQGPDWVLYVGRERGECRAGDRGLELAIRATRWFVLRGAEWRQMHRHGSIEQAHLLAAHQGLVLGSGP